MTVDVVCFGETMALVAPDPPQPLTVAAHLVLSCAGAESNVAVSLARLGSRAQWCSRLGDDPFGHRILDTIAGAGVGIDAVRLCPGQRTGVFFKNPEHGRTSVLYYRDRSAAAGMDDTDVDRALASGPRILHLTGITPALSESCFRAVDYAVGRAKDSGVLVSFDVNYRPALWSDPARAGHELQRTAQRADIVFVGLDEAAALWGATTETEVRALIDRPDVLVVKDGARSATGFDRDRRVEVPAVPVDVVEPVGAGDAFAAGWLHAHLRGRDAVEALRLGHLVAAGSLTSATDHSREAVAAQVLERLAASQSGWPPHPWPLAHDGRS